MLMWSVKLNVLCLSCRNFKSSLDCTIIDVHLFILHMFHHKIVCMNIHIYAVCMMYYYNILYNNIILSFISLIIINDRSGCHRREKARCVDFSPSFPPLHSQEVKALWHIWTFLDMLKYWPPLGWGKLLGGDVEGHVTPPPPRYLRPSTDSLDVTFFIVIASSE